MSFGILIFWPTSSTTNRYWILTWIIQVIYLYSTNSQELCSLCKLHGIQGIKYLNRFILEQIVHFILHLRSIIQMNSGLLSEHRQKSLASNAIHCNLTAELKNFQQLDSFTVSALRISNLVRFRMSLNKAMKLLIHRDQVGVFLETLNFAQRQSMRESVGKDVPQEVLGL